MFKIWETLCTQGNPIMPEARFGTRSLLKDAVTATETHVYGTRSRVE